VKSRKKISTRRVIARALLIAIVLVAFYFLVKPLAKVDYRLANLKIKSEHLDSRISVLQRELDKLESDVVQYSTGPGIELIAREKLRMIYSGETLYTCRDSQGGQDYLIFDGTTQPLSINYRTKSPFARAWDMILSLFR